MFSLAVILRESEKAAPGKPAIRHDAGAMNYAELDGLSDSVADGLVARGIRPGDAVGLQLPNIPLRHPQGTRPSLGPSSASPRRGSVRWRRTCPSGRTGRSLSRS
ncbi:AMP-binding enzyme [Nonomuraea solani]|uniref:AMP-binding enzyme n=1 Tax=Nonomuraea solani TaxID=1144553 RepID=A0A1H6F1Q3_9ACTN|nr:AMP-binding protein [Nonomuraea solani]SEH04002.1 AMP-binding enzyme [Nonomuraea solani]